ncbi:hypothetical protein SFUMM280S_10052 [Streptomyces fumanus]
MLVLAAGPADARPTVTPVFDAVGSRTVWTGEDGAAGSATRLKLVANRWVSAGTNATGEVLAPPTATCSRTPSATAIRSWAKPGMVGAMTDPFLCRGGRGPSPRTVPSLPPANQQPISTVTVVPARYDGTGSGRNT